jgi:AhpD family alkylhydroperoxidase
MNAMKAAPGAYQALAGVEAYLRQCGLERPLLELVRLRVSQVNHCAFCLDMHWKDARAAGETEQRLYGLSAWREAPYYTDRERAALAWAEALTVLTDGFAPDDVFDAVRPHFNDKELADLTTAIVSINGWNRLCVGFRVEPGTYQPPAHRDAAAANS